MDVFATRHLTTYEHVADQYEQQADTHLASLSQRIDRLVSHLPVGSHVIDVGCGVGLAMSLLRSKGMIVTGIDLSPRMAEYARRRNLGNRIIVGDFRAVTLSSRYDAVLADAIVHLFPKSATCNIFNKFRALLKPMGIISVATTRHEQDAEFWTPKAGYIGSPLRYRAYWTQSALRCAVSNACFTVLDYCEITDSAAKTWMVITARCQP